MKRNHFSAQSYGTELYEGLSRLCVFSFTRADRIRKHPEFVRLSKHGKAVYNQNFVALVCPGRFDKNMLGITVSKKVGNAVVRNRTKRLIREYFRHNRHNITGNWDINIIAKAKAAHLSTEQTFLSLANIFNKISRSGEN